MFTTPVLLFANSETNARIDPASIDFPAPRAKGCRTTYPPGREGGLPGGIKNSGRSGTEIPSSGRHRRYRLTACSSDNVLAVRL